MRYWWEGRESGGEGKGEKFKKGWVSQFERKYGSDEGIDKEGEVGESSVGGGKGH